MRTCTLPVCLGWSVILVLVVCATQAGCGVLTTARSTFLTQFVDADGNPLSLEDLQEITTDSDLTPDQMARELRNLGLADEELIDAIVEDGLPEDPTVGVGDVPDVGDVDTGDGDADDGGGDGNDGS